MQRTRTPTSSSSVMRREKAVNVDRNDSQNSILDSQIMTQMLLVKFKV